MVKLYSLVNIFLEWKATAIGRNMKNAKSPRCSSKNFHYFLILMLNLCFFRINDLFIEDSSINIEVLIKKILNFFSTAITNPFFALPIQFLKIQINSFILIKPIAVSPLFTAFNAYSIYSNLPFRLIKRIIYKYLWKKKLSKKSHSFYMKFGIDIFKVKFNLIFFFIYEIF